MDAVINTKEQNNNTKTTEIVSWLLSNGRTAVTNNELSDIFGICENHISQRLTPLVKRNEIFSPVHGLWIPIPFEYRQWGAPEAIYYIDKMMTYLGVNYYVGWMTAAAILGASHHSSQVFQVATSKHIRNRVIGRSDCKFFQRSNVNLLPTFRHKTQTGTIKVSTRAATMLSVTNDLSNASGLDNVANIIIELSDTKEEFINEIVASAELFSISALRRLGWILENFTKVDGLDKLVLISQKSDTKRSKLSTYKNYSDCIDKKWLLDINERIDPDV